MPPLDPLRRWRQLGEKPDYAGLLSFAGLPWTEDPGDLSGVDAAIVGAPTDDLVSDRPGARLAPRAIRAAGCPPGPHLDAGVDALAELRVVDFGDAACVPADPVASHEAIAATVGEVLDAGALPVVLGGDHGISTATIAAAGQRRGPVGLVHLDAHADTGEVVFGVRRSHGTPMRRLVEAGHVAGERYVQLGLRGYWPGPEVFAWQGERGIRHHLMSELRERGLRRVLDDALAALGDGPVWLSVDIDVVEPGALGGGTGTPEPGGMAVADLLETCRVVASSVDLCGAEVVEVIPTAVGSADTAAVIADRVVREVLTGLALRRQAP
ncbi:MAG TPA: agmatinase family protein [Salinarimonas sp.]|nr:agmatinase family protein [Salinarimonas sp.]